VTTPRSSCPGGEYISSPGRSKPPAHSKINTVTENAAPSASLDFAHLQATWVIFGKQVWVTSGKRRSTMVHRVVGNWDDPGDVCMVRSFIFVYTA
jgi:hypothetical protein